VVPVRAALALLPLGLLLLQSGLDLGQPALEIGDLDQAGERSEQMGEAGGALRIDHALSGLAVEPR
jgi:hypothetical protein